MALLCLLLPLSPAAAEDGKARKKPPEPLTAEQAADAVLAAIKAKNDDALRALAGSDQPDPWLVADELCGRGQVVAARALAAAGAHVDTKKLPAYVAAAKERPADRAAFRVVRKAIRARDTKKILEGTEAQAVKLDSVLRIRLLHVRSLALVAARRTREGEDAMRSAADAAQALGWLRRAAALYHRAGHAATRRFAWQQAVADWETCRALGDQRGDVLGTARALNNLGLAYRERGDHEKALARFQRALASARALDKKKLAATVLGNIAIVYETLGDHTQALATYEEAYKQKIALGEKGSATVTLGNIGAIHDTLGNLRKALSIQQRVFEQRTALGDHVGAAESLGDIGSARHGLGQYAKALSAYERAVARQLELRDLPGAARTLGNLAGLYQALGRYGKALETGERAHAMQEKMGDRAAAAVTRGNIGLMRASRGEDAKAIVDYRAAHATLLELARPREALTVAANLANAQHRLGQHDRARESLGAVLKAQDAGGERVNAAYTRLTLAYVHRAQGRTKEALRLTERVVRVGRSTRDTALFVAGLRNLVGLLVETGETARALSEAERALDALEGLLGGLGEETGAAARERHASLYALGALAAIREKDAAAAVTFLESGRAGALLDALGRREALRWKAESLSSELREAEVRARSAEVVARRAYDRAVRLRRLAAARDALVVLDKALAESSSVASRIERELKDRAGLYYTRAETIETIQRGLRADQALVLYGLCQGEAFAMVLRRDGERVVALGRRSKVVAACRALEASDAAADATAPLAALRALIVTPLKLDASVKQVFISPEGPLCYLPFGALIDRAVALTPSGSTHVVLLGAQSERGTGILALGDPDYAGASKGAQAVYHRGRSLASLPGSRVEAKTVGSTVLLGKDASESGLRKTLATAARWRSVHLACHGLVDVERPMLSSLALSKDAAEDGFVTMREILGMRIPADLAVLSACETGRGRNRRGEGIVGLARAFMFAGAPRVICSLWKVDDAATQALMVRFYELWNPKDGTQGMGVAVALKKAQEYVRDFRDESGKRKWKHPYYWAAWVLWGLAD